MNQEKNSEQKTNVHERFLQAIGLITVAYGMLETHLSLAISGLITTEQSLGDILTAELSFRGKVDVFAAIVKLRTSDKIVLEEMRKILGPLRSACEQRNAIVHSTLFQEFGNAELYKQRKIAVRSNRGLSISEKDLTVKDLEQIGHAIQDVNFKLIIFLQKHVEQLSGKTSNQSKQGSVAKSAVP